MEDKVSDVTKYREVSDGDGVVVFTNKGSYKINHSKILINKGDEILAAYELMNNQDRNILQVDINNEEGQIVKQITARKFKHQFKNNDITYIR